MLIFSGVAGGGGEWGSGGGLPEVFILPHTHILSIWWSQDFINVCKVFPYRLLNVLKENIENHAHSKGVSHRHCMFILQLE